MGKIVLPALGLLVCVATAQAGEYALPVEGNDLVGEARTVRAKAEETLADIALREGVGFRKLLDANPEVDAWLPTPDADVRLPTRMILPRTSRQGVVINVPEMRLYFYPPQPALQKASRRPGAAAADATAATPEVWVMPIAVGRDDWRTPLGVTRIKALLRDPWWRPTPSIRAEHEADGDPLPELVPPGPDNPLGPLALALDMPSVLIHGTNRPYGIGMPVTHGCLRVGAEDMEKLFAQVAVGTPVVVIDEPYKLGHGGGRWHLEAHRPLGLAEGEAIDLDAALARVRLLAEQRQAALDWNAVTTTLREARGIPLPVDELPAETAARPDH